MQRTREDRMFGSTWINPRQSTTPPKTNMEPQNGGLEDEFPVQSGDFQVSS